MRTKEILAVTLDKNIIRIIKQIGGNKSAFVESAIIEKLKKEKNPQIAEYAEYLEWGNELYKKYEV